MYYIKSESTSAVNEAVEINLLSSILTLYLRVRTFSFTKDIVTKKKRKIANDKALRKSLKQASKQKNEGTKYILHVDNIICHMIYGYIRINEQILILSLNIFFVLISLKGGTIIKNA